MDKSLLKHQVVIEVGEDQATVYYSRKVSEEVDKVVKEVAPESTPPVEYCHACFNVPCTCKSSGLSR